MKKEHQNKNRKKTIFLLFFVSTVLLVPGYYVYAQVMQSSTYKMQSDSINAGGTDSTSSNYNLNDTVGEVGTGESSSSIYSVKAGYWQMQEGYLALSSPPDVSLGTIAGLGGDSSEGTAAWTVTTDNAAGYTMTIVADTTPALQSAGASFSDYTPSTSVPDYTFSIDPTTSAFGFSPEGLDVAARYKDNGSTCAIGALETTGKCWDGLSTTPKTIVSRTSANQPSGTVTTVRLHAESGASHTQPAGTYAAHITVTATTL